MSEQRVTLSRIDIQQRLAKLHEHVSRADSDRLDRILPLFRLAGNTRANMAECLDEVSPNKKADRQKQQADFRQFRKHLCTAFDKAGLGIELTVDSRKRTDVTERECWFTGPPISRTAERIEQFSQSAADTDGPKAIEPLGLDSKLIGRPAVRCCILSAASDHALAAKLADSLRSEFKAQSEFAYDVWDRASVVAGERLTELQREAVRRADVLLLFVSPAFLAEEEHRSAIRKPGSDSIPVALKPLSQLQDLSPFGECEVFHLRSPRAAAKSFDECDGKQRVAFVRQLFDRIHDCATVPTMERPAINEVARGLTEFFPSNDPDDPVEPRGTQARFGEDVTKRAAGADAAGAVRMFKALNDWFRQPKSAVYAAILGESGIGKTTLLKTQTLQLIKARQQDPSLPLPIYIDLRLFVPTIQEEKRVPANLVDLLDELLGRARHRGDTSGISGEDIVRMVQSEGAILIFDGLDEKLVHLDENQGMALMRVLWEALPFSVVRKQRHADAVRHGRLVFSCRSHYFKSLREQNALFLGEGREDLRTDDYCAWVLLPFNDEQVREYLERTIGQERVEPTIELFRSVHNLDELSGRPLLLSLMVPQIDTLEQMRARGEPVYGVTLYDMLVARWLTRDGGKHHIRPEDKVTLMQNIAAAMWIDGRREWGWNEVRDWLASQLVRTDVLQARYRRIEFEILEEDFRTATFVLRPSQSESSFRFAHTSLQEYFLACFLKACLLAEDAAGWNLPLPSRETLVFLGQLLAVEQQDKRRYEKCMRTLSDILGGREAHGKPQAALVAFHYWLLAIENDLPEPAPRHVNLEGANLYGLQIRGRSTDKRINLVRANLRGCNLRGGARLENVDLTEANLSSVRAEFVELVSVRARGLHIDNANLTGAIWRRCDSTELGGVSTATLVGSRWLDCRLDEASCPALLTSGGVISAPGSPQGSRPSPNSAELRTLQGHSRSANACSFSGDGTRIISASSDQTLKLWDAVTGECLRTLAGHSSSVVSCEFSPSGERIVSSSYDRTLKLWDAATGKCFHTLEGHSNSVNCCGFSPDGARIVSASYDQTLKLWDVETGECQHTLRGHSSNVLSCGFSADGARIVSASYDQTLKLWDAATGKWLLTFSGHSNSVNSCSFSPDDARIVSASDDQTLKLWDAATGECLATLRDHSSNVMSCGFSADGARIVSASSDQTGKLWDAATGECLTTFRGHSSDVLSCGFSSGGEWVVSASDDQTLKLWDTATGECLHTLQGHSRPVWSCDFSADGARIVSASHDQSLKLWDAVTGECLSTFQGHSRSVRSCGFSPDGARIVSVSNDQTMKLWDATTGKRLRTFQGHKNCVVSCDFSPDGSRIVSASYDQTLMLWDVATGECRRTLRGHSSNVLSCAFSFDGARIVSASYDQTVKLWDAATGECLRTLRGHKSLVSSCRFSPAGARIVSASHDQTLKLWDAATGECLQTLRGHESLVNSCRFSPDGARIVSASHDRALKLWDAVTGECLRTLEGHSRSVWSCGFSPDGARIVSASSDQTLKLWDVATGTCLMTLVDGVGNQQAAIDTENKRILWAGEGAWRLLRWHYDEPETGKARLLPAEHFGPLPTTPVSS